MALHSPIPDQAQAAGLEALRERVRRLERGGREAPRQRLPLGPAELDAALPGGGLALAGLHEILPQRAEWDDGPATGFCLALAARILEARPGRLLWVSQAGDLHVPAAAAAGIPPGRLLEVRVRSRLDGLWALEEALRCPELAAVIGELDELDALAARRLQLAAESAGKPCLLLHRPRLAGRGERLASPALTRWRIAAAPSDETLPGTLVGRPRWRVALERCRGGRPADFLLEWHDEHSTWDDPAWKDAEPQRAPAGALSLAAGLRDRAGAGRAGAAAC
jgi:protein ImuA